MERPILFSTPMVQAILAGRKTQTRRTKKLEFINEVPFDSGLNKAPYKKIGNWFYQLQTAVDDSREYMLNCPYGQIGDILWVRETWRIVHINHRLKTGDFFEIQFKDYSTKRINQDFLRNKFYEKPYEIGSIGDAYSKWKPSIFMPKEACRIRLEITNIRVERVQDISEKDAKSEGAPESMSIEELKILKGLDWILPSPFQMHQFTFLALLCKINGKKSWLKNPWVWVIEFKRIE